MSSPVTVRREQATDVEAVEAVVAAAFGDGPRVPDLVRALRPFSTYEGAGREAPHPPFGLGLVAERDGEVVGHVLLTRCYIDAWDGLARALLLSPLSVQPERQRGGVGMLLLRGAVALAQDLAAPAVFLEGSPAYYGARGFDTAGPLGFRRPSLRIPAPAFQVRLLPAYQGWMTGTVVYPSPFWDLDCVGLRDRDLVAAIEGAAGPAGG